MKRLLIAGCGDLGQRLADRLDPDLWEVTGLRRDPSRLPSRIRPLAADLTRPATLAGLASDYDAIVYQATPPERRPEAYRAIYVEGLRHLLAASRFRDLIMVSSTAVYGQDDGAWVDEESATEPAGFNGRILLEAEALAREAGGRVLRCSGIYGPGRTWLLRQLAGGQARCRERPPEWTNRIHADDVAGVLAHLLERPDLGPVLCASDDRPSPRCEVLDWLAAELGLAAPRRDPDGAGAAGKRIRNQRLRDSGYDFIHPDYRSGYRELIEEQS
ncbi:SDR family oxidoreductase [Wenzhouxiangella marina]|uniref:NAD-dependent epimerase/dehydratase n=1 Tax=Wenzhouxiangella marina TaxID=1579979 RepID=A0A0K0XSR9_9GAMM|nr:SDR family oxidoreductase [Wenzhouxiangella marina]AKS40681.1 NAD-dependent epimerase/dehydratase [Wenzhouxiangella marina]MBB6088451.1 nucleoside-diphosphate-sugar epimerase [Wenzhouxiangella marina]